MKKSNVVLRLCAIVSAVSFIAFLFYFVQMPDIVPVHWNFKGEVDGYGPKAIMLIFAALPLLIVGLMAALPRLDPRRENYARHAKVFNIFTIGLTLCFMVVTWMFVVEVNGSPLPVGRILPGIMGILFIVIGNYMPQIKPNYFMGIRTPWALENDTVWRKTHHAGGIMFMVCGAFMVLSAFMPMAILGYLTAAWVFLLLAGCVGLYVYSYRLFKKIGPRKDDRNAED